MRHVDGLVGYYPHQAMHDQNRIIEHIEAVAERNAAETASLIRRISRVCWPGGAVDRTEPSARSWLQRWRPARAAAPLPSCSCPRHCAVCN